MSDNKSFFTKAVHAGEDTSEHHGALSVPIYNASTYAFENADEGKAIHNYEKHGYFYGRLGNPTQEALEKAVAELENGEAAIAFASGMAAISAAVLSLVKTGEHIVALDSMYSTSSIFFQNISETLGIDITYVDATDAVNYENAIRPETRMLWIETPSNPRLNITDISAVVEVAKANNILTVADNTFASPFNQNPIDFGVDVVMHSATKYLGGHSDLSAGILVGSNEIIDEIYKKGVKLFGGGIAPQVAWLVLRGIKTLALRMKQHNKNAYAIANMLQNHIKVKEVFYPNLESHKNKEIARKQMRGFGGMISFDVGGIEEGKTFINNLEICSIATSLGGVESIVQHSASMTHATLSKEEREKAGISDGLIRFSVGIEDKEDLIRDLENALNKI
ncbi:MAG: PLP-dependent aspartate aminotransferase family protein [Acidobacteriota bacterium]|jgi:methionine-gamma-lyase|nr:PLP-dependent aspartate aminotransferase family protein [Acidobacteriota bacterium]